MADTIPARLFDHAERRPGSAAYFEKVEGEYRPTTWGEYADQVRRAGKSLIALGFSPGQHVTILGFNRPEWIILDVACMAVGGAPAGIYATNSPEEVQYIAGHAEAPLMLVEDKAQLEKVLAVRTAPRVHTTAMAAAHVVSLVTPCIVPTSRIRQLVADHLRRTRRWVTRSTPARSSLTKSWRCTI